MRKNSPPTAVFWFTATEQTAIVEEPFDELNEIDVGDVPLRLAAAR